MWTIHCLIELDDFIFNLSPGDNILLWSITEDISQNFDEHIVDIETDKVVLEVVDIGSAGLDNPLQNTT